MIVAATILALFIAASHEHKNQTLILMFGVMATATTVIRALMDKMLQNSCRCDRRLRARPALRLPPAIGELYQPPTIGEL